MNDNFSKADEIKKLKELLDSNAITAEEYNQQKKLLLDSTPPDSPNPSMSPNQSAPPSAVYTATTVPPVKKKRNGCLTAILILFGVMILLVVILIATGNNAMKSGSATSGSTLGGSSANSKLSPKAALLEFDAKSWKDFVQLYHSHNNLMKNIDAFSNGKISSLDFLNYCTKSEEYFRESSLGFSYGTTADEKTYLDVFRSAALSDQMAAKALIKYIDSLKTSDLSDVQKNIQDAKTAYEMIASNRGLLLVKAGLTDEEIKEKITEDMTLLESEYGPAAAMVKQVCGTDTAKSITIAEILGGCGVVNIDSITHDDALDDMDEVGEKGYRISGHGQKNIILYLSEDGSVYTIRWSDSVLYANGQTTAKLSDFLD